LGKIEERNKLRGTKPSQIEVEVNILCRERENEGHMEEDYEDVDEVSP
jgi:hypothetical protein